MKQMMLKPMKAKFSYPDEFREPAPEMRFSGMIVTVIGPDEPLVVDAHREDYGECLMRCRTDAGEEFVAFETELEEILNGQN